MAAFDETIGAELADMIDYLSRQGFDVQYLSPCADYHVIVNRSSVKRLLDNIASNIGKYAERTEPVCIEYVQSDTHTGITIRNAIASNPDRREGMGIGHANIASMMDELGGFCSLREEAGVFEITLWFKKA